MSKTRRERTTNITHETLLDTLRAIVDGKSEGPGDEEFREDLRKVLSCLEAGPGKASFARGTFVACYLTVSDPVANKVDATLCLVPHDGRWARVQGVEIKIKAGSSKRLQRTGFTPGLTIRGLPSKRVRVELGPHSSPLGQVRPAPRAMPQREPIARLGASPNVAPSVTHPEPRRSERVVPAQAGLQPPPPSGLAGTPPVVTGLQLVTPPMLLAHSRRRPDINIANIFAPLAAEDPQLRTCLSAILYSPKGNMRLPSFPVEEYCYIHLRGRMCLQFEGAEGVELDASNEISVVWVPGYGRSGERTPPANVVCKDFCAGLVVFFRAAGLGWTRRGRGSTRVSLEGQNEAEWSPAERTDYWGYLREVAPGLISGCSPFVSQLPRERKKAEKAFRSRKLPKQPGDVHQRARTARQIDYAAVPRWPSSPQDRLLKESVGLAGRTLPIFDFRLLRFPKQQKTVDKGDVWLGRHPNGYEILIPILGEFRAVGGELKECQPDVCWVRPKALEVDLQQLTDLRVSATPERLLNDYVAVHSDAVFHGFVAAGQEDAYALHVRVAHSVTPRIQNPQSLPNVCPGQLPLVRRPR